MLDARPHVMTIKEAAERYGLREFTIRQWVKRGQLPAIYSGRKIMISQLVLERFLNGEFESAN